MRALRSSFFLFTLSIIAVPVIDVPYLWGQDSATGSIRGTVLDPTGARVPQASVAVVNAGTGTRFTATSDAAGTSALEQLPRETTRFALKLPACLLK